MSTRANIIVKDARSEVILYRHSDGYPEETMIALNKYMDWVRSGHVRNNVTQSVGWLIILGALEYCTIPKYETEKPGSPTLAYAKIETVQEPRDWKSGAFEITDSIHFDIEYLYTVDLETKEITCKERQNWGDDVKDWPEIPMINIAGYKHAESIVGG